MNNKFFETMFTQSVKTAQERYGSRKHYVKFEGKAIGIPILGNAERDFIESRDGFYIATVNEHQQPYIQFRGGPLVSSKCWTNTHSDTLIFAATCSTSASAISERTTRPRYS